LNYVDPIQSISTACGQKAGFDWSPPGTDTIDTTTQNRNSQPVAADRVGCRRSVAEQE